MNRNIIRSLAIFICSLLLFSCKKSYLDTFSSTAVSSSDVLSSTRNAYIALNGIHRIMYTQYDAQPQGGEAGAMIIRDLMGEDELLTIASGRQDFGGHIRYTDQRNPNSVNTAFVFRMYYRFISNANVLINGIDGATGPQNEKDLIKGQSLVYRAWSHFNLVQLWAQPFVAGATNDQPGIPLMLTATLAPQARASVGEVYKQINKDLDEAIILLANYNRNTFGSTDPATSKSQLDRSVAYAIKARVTLAQSDWANTAKFAALARTGYTLMSNAQYKMGFNDATNPEWIWASHQISDQNSYFYSFFASMGANFNGSSVKTQPKAINSVLWEALPATDIRKAVFSKTGSTVPVPPGGAKIPYQNQKFLAASSALSIGDVPLIRAAEMYLTEAEAYARLGQIGPAQDALFTLMKNRNPSYVKSTNTGDALIQEIMNSRRVELWGEGFRFTDIKRLGLGLDRTVVPNTNLAISVIDKIPAGDKLFVWLFPQDEINANPLLVQNPL